MRNLAVDYGYYDSNILGIFTIRSSSCYPGATSSATTTDHSMRPLQQPIVVKRIQYCRHLLHGVWKESVGEGNLLVDYMYSIKEELEDCGGGYDGHPPPILPFLCMPSHNDRKMISSSSVSTAARSYRAQAPNGVPFAR